MQPTQDPSTPGLHPDNEAMKLVQNAAISSNEKAFPVFAKRLASKDAKEFSGTARKLAVWLGSEKAYYPAARPKIVELLEIALSAFVDTFAHHQSFADFAELLRQLVQAIVPFKKLFPENELQSRLQRVIMDTERTLSALAKRIAQGNMPPQGIATPNIPSLTVVPPVNVHPLPMAVSANSPVPGPSTSTLPFSTQGGVKVVSDNPIQLDTRNSTEVVSSPTDTKPFLTSPVINTQHEACENVPPSISSKPQPKRARKAELSEDLIARDLDWFKSNQAPTIVNGVTSKIGRSLASDIPHIPGWSPSPKKKTFRMVPSRRLPRRIPSDVQTTESVTLPPPREPSSEGTISKVEGVSVQNVTEPHLSLEKTLLEARSVPLPEVHGIQEVSPYEELSKPQPLATPLNGLSVKPEIPQANQPSPSTRAPFISGESASLAPSIRLPEPMSYRTGSLDVFTSDSGSEGFLPEAPRNPEFTPPRSPEVLQLQGPILPPLVGALEPPLDLNFNISQISAGDPQQSVIDENQRFDGEMTIVLVAQGKSFTHRHEIDISLEERVFSRISKWINRRFHPPEAPQGVCISLACYRIPELFEKVNLEGGKPNIRGVMSQSSCSWPCSNQLSLHVNDETRHTIITLSPPLFLTPNQCVDISSLMKLGENTLEIRQQGDLSEYLLVLHAHHPTRAQLSELDVVKIADERWKRFLDVLSAQIVPGGMLGTTPAGVGVF